jgi:hypothetical protein
MDITTSVIAATIGGAIACFLAIASAEVLTPGSVDWALKGGSYGAAIGVPAAFVLGPLGLLEDRHSLQRN